MPSHFDFALLRLINRVIFGENMLKVYEGPGEREENMSWRF